MPLPPEHAAHDKRRYTRLSGVFDSDVGYVSIGDPYKDGRTQSGPPAGVIGSVTAVGDPTTGSSESKASFFPPRLCWGGQVPGSMTAREPGVDADTWRRNSRATLPSPGRTKLLRTTGLLNGQTDRSPRLPAVFMPSSPGKAGAMRNAYFSIPRWEQDSYGLKEEAAIRERKEHAAKILRASFMPGGGTKSWVTKKIDTSVPPREPRLYDPWLQ